MLSLNLYLYDLGCQLFPICIFKQFMTFFFPDLLKTVLPKECYF